MAEGRHVLAVYGTVTLIGHHEVKIGMVETAGAELPGYGVQGTDHNLALQAATAAVKHCTRPVTQVIVEGFLGLFGQFNAVGQKEHPGDGGGLEPSLHEHGDGQRLASTGGHFEEHAPAIGDHSGIGSVEAFNLAGTRHHLLALEDKL